jgi:hypothetical protein
MQKKLMQIFLTVILDFIQFPTRCPIKRHTRAHSFLLDFLPFFCVPQPPVKLTNTIMLMIVMNDDLTSESQQKKSLYFWPMPI